MTPRVSVVVPTYQRRDRLERVLTALAAQTCVDDLEVIVVSDGSTDGTDEYLQSGETPLPVTALSQQNAGPAAARNNGVAHATGELVLFIDDDVVPMPTCVEHHLAAHAANGPDVVVLGPMLDPPDATFTPWVAYEQAMLTKQYDAMERGDWEPTARQFYTGNASLRRQHLLDAGGFDASFRRAEDVELAYRLAERGLRFVFVMKAEGHHHAERSFDSWRATPYTYGRNDVVFARDHGQAWLLPTIKDEFRHQRHPAVQVVVLATRDRPWVRRPVLRLLEWVLGVVDGVGLTGLARPAVSLLHNVLYYQGVADEQRQVPPDPDVAPRG